MGFRCKLAEHTGGGAPFRSYLTHDSFSHLTPPEARQEVFCRNSGKILIFVQRACACLQTCGNEFIFVFYSFLCLPAPSPRSTDPSLPMKIVKFAKFQGFVIRISCLRAHCSGGFFRLPLCVRTSHTAYYAHSRSWDTDRQQSCTPP